MWVGRKEVTQGVRVSSVPTWVLNTLENLLTEPPALERGGDAILACARWYIALIDAAC